MNPMDRRRQNTDTLGMALGCMMVTIFLLGVAMVITAIYLAVHNWGH